MVTTIPQARRSFTRAPRNRHKRLPWIAHLGAWLYAAALIVPAYYLVVSSFKSNLEIFSTPFAWPSSFDFGNYVAGWEQTALGQGLLNSVYITVASVAVVLVLAVPAAYGLARAKGRCAVIAERVFSLGFLIPTFAALVPTVLLAIALGLFHTQIYVIMYLPASAMPLSVILLTQFMRTVPPELEASAMLDGASRFTILRLIYIPIAMPGIATVIILNFLSFWNEYLFVLTLAGTDTDVRTAQVAVPTLIQQNGTQFGVLSAATVITLLPVFIAYAILSRRMEEALLSGAVKS